MKPRQTCFSGEYVFGLDASHRPDVYQNNKDSWIDPRVDQYGLSKEAESLGLSRPHRVVIKAKIGE